MCGLLSWKAIGGDNHKTGDRIDQEDIAYTPDAVMCYLGNLHRHLWGAPIMGISRAPGIIGFGKQRFFSFQVGISSMLGWAEMAVLAVSACTGPLQTSCTLA